MSLTNDFFKEVKGLAEDFHSLREENARLKSENERLRKAGDAIVKDNLKWITNHDHIAAWNAAKKGIDKPTA